jgi:hypothetical protein
MTPRMWRTGRRVRKFPVGQVAFETVTKIDELSDVKEMAKVYRLGSADAK